MQAKSFLLQECANAKLVLDETLRFKYGSNASEEFFDECSIRLQFIKSEIEAAAADDFSALATNGYLLSELSKLISRIERSSLGQYSWPFVDELKKIAIATCAESTLTNPNTPPMVHVLSDGGLDAYQIFPEQQRPSAGKRRILTIIFPQTLKHFVLLHAILGHEIAHAIWRSSKHQADLRDTLVNSFVASHGRFSSIQTTLDWLYATNAPAEISNQLASLGAQGVPKNKFFEWADLDAWYEEILCDLIGLVTFGPSFIAAECKLLYSLSLDGTGIGQQHPPVACRVNLLLTAARLLGYTSASFPEGMLKDAFNEFWGAIETRRNTDPWFDIFTEAEIQSALNGITTLLSGLPPAMYPKMDEAIVSELFDQLISGVPPVGFRMNAELEPETYIVDFRHILFAGWLAYKHPGARPFDELNRLCEHGIMQQIAIDKFNQSRSGTNGSTI